MVSVDEIMTSGLFTLGPEDSMVAVDELMYNKNIRHVPIVSAEGGLIGIVSHRDLLSATPVSSESKSNIYSNTTTSEIMRTGVETISPSSNARLAAMTLERMKIGCLPVVENSQLVGIITSSDFIATAINLMEQIEFSEDTF